MFKSKNILQQEEEFLKLNQEIDLTTKDLLSQVDALKLNNEKSYSDWSTADPITGVQLEEELQKSETSVNTPNTAMNEYLSMRADDSTTQSEDATLQQNPTDRNKVKLKHSLKTCHSAKIVPSLVSAQEQDSTLSLGVIRHKSDVRPRQGKSETDVIPETLKGVGQDGITRFLSAKVKLLTEQLEVVQRDEKKHLEKIKELQAFKDKSTEERERLIQQVNMSRSALIKLEQHSNNISTQLQTVKTENIHLKKELETLKREIRQNNKTHNASEIKLNRTLEEAERLKATIQQMKQEEKECKEIQRKKIENMTIALKKLDRQRTELLNGFKKQLLIIDNLKRQKDLIEAGKLLKCAEDDFINYLECNPMNTVRTSETLKSGKS